jgi:hypothetical protein
MMIEVPSLLPNDLMSINRIFSGEIAIRMVGLCSFLPFGKNRQATQGSQKSIEMAGY